MYQNGVWAIAGAVCAYLVEAHRPALKDLIPPGELRKYARRSEHD